MNKFPEKEREKISDRIIKWKMKGAIVGGIWGLISGIMYGWNFFASGFGSYDMMSSMFDSFFEIIIFFPAFLTERIFNCLFQVNEILLLVAIPIFALVLWIFIIKSIKISRKIYRKICIGGGLLLLFLAIIGFNPLLLLGIIFIAIIPFLLSVAIGIYLASLLFIFSQNKVEKVQ